MFKLEQVLLLKEDEKVKAMTKRHALALVPGLLLSLVLIVAPFFFLFPLFRTGPTGVIVFAVLVIVGAIIAARTFVMWDGDVFIVTSLRIIDVDQRGFFSRTVSEVNVADIQDVSWAKDGMLDMMFGIGTLRVSTYSGTLVIKAPFIPRPQELHHLVNDLRHEVGSGESAPVVKTEDVDPHRADVLKRVASRIESLDDQELTKLDRTLKQDDRDIAIKKLFGDGDGDDQLKPLEDAS